MAQHLRYDADGNEKIFLHAVDAREAVELGFYFETNPVEDAKKRAAIVKEKEGIAAPAEDKKKAKKEKEEVVPEPVIEDVKIDEE
jgi:hypothetical protein